MVPLVLRLVLLATAIRVRHVTTVLHAVTSVQIARLAHLMATVLLVVILVQIARLVLLVTAILVRLAMTVAHAATSVQTARLVHSTVTRVRRVTTALLVVILDQIARLVHLMVTAILVHVVTLVQTAQRVRLVPTVMVVVQTA
jgi:hypothetical protein